MSLVPGLAAISGTLRGAAGLVREFRRPRLNSADFAEVLKERIRQAPASSAQERQLQAALVQSSRFLDWHDANADKLLTLEESALTTELFEQLDLDSNGFLSADELKAGYLAAINGRGPKLPLQDTE
ncbi:MAG: hypothetical protein HYV26_12375 [Candidatus Hydrogenedentes bacterium]|nr:hypothetical protein [Candidatus Hydrogenedentota bacterium]